jgi:hypothetical protein
MSPPRRRTEGAGRIRPSGATLLLHRLHRHGVGHGAVFAARRKAIAAVPTYFGIVAVVPRTALMTGNAQWGCGVNSRKRRGTPHLLATALLG